MYSITDSFQSHPPVGRFWFMVVVGHKLGTPQTEPTREENANKAVVVHSPLHVRGGGSRCLAAHWFRFFPSYSSNCSISAMSGVKSTFHFKNTQLRRRNESAFLPCSSYGDHFRPLTCHVVDDVIICDDSKQKRNRLQLVGIRYPRLAPECKIEQSKHHKILHRIMY